jgi:rod shape determining protein RodA
MLERPWYATLNYPLAASAIALSLFGLLIIKSATLHSPGEAGDVVRQAIYLVIGVAAMSVLAFVDYHVWQRLAWPIYLVNLVLLGTVLLAGHSALGAQRWIGVGSIVFQPSEPAKLLTVLSLGALLANPKRSYTRLRDLWLPVAAVIPPVLLVLKQPDLGTAFVFVIILSVMLFFAVPRWWHVAVYAAGVLAAGAFVVLSPSVLKEYQRRRLLAFLHPQADPQGSGWSLIQSSIAIGSGRLTGKGLYQGTQTQLGFVPEHATDFIFTVVGEELGFVGSLILLALYGVLFGSAVAVLGAARDKYGLLVAAGIAAMFVFQVFINIGMTVGIMPITGIPLPFISYGGSSLITCFMGVGILLNIHSQKYKMLFAD